MKKILAIALSLTMLLALAVPAFATEDESIFALDVYEVDFENDAYVPCEHHEGEELAHEAGDTVFFRVDYHMPYLVDFEYHEEGNELLLMTLEAANLTDVDLVAAMTTICVGDICGLPTGDLTVFDEIFDRDNLTIDFTYGYSGYMVFEGTLAQTAETSFGVEVAYGDIYSESASTLFNAGVVATDEPTDEDPTDEPTDDEPTTDEPTTDEPIPQATNKPGDVAPAPTGSISLVAIALVSAISGLGALSLRKKN